MSVDNRFAKRLDKMIEGVEPQRLLQPLRKHVWSINYGREKERGLHNLRNYI